MKEICTLASDPKHALFRSGRSGLLILKSFAINRPDEEKIATALAAQGDRLVLPEGFFKYIGPSDYRLRGKSPIIYRCLKCAKDVVSIQKLYTLF